MSNKQDWHVVSFSGGKDSTAMLLMMLEKDMQIDDIIFCDTGLEFPQMYEHLKKVEEMIGRKITILKSEKPFEYYLYQHIKTRGKTKGEKGYGFPSSRLRWCNSNLKMKPIRDYRKKHKDKNIIMYVGIAYDEQKRIKEEKYPLIEWGITEKMALNYCLKKGLDWGGLYDKFDRVSCWCCPITPLKAVKALYFNFPHLWAKLKEWEKLSNSSFRLDYNTDELEEKFECEAKGKKYRRKKK